MSEAEEDDYKTGNGRFPRGTPRWVLVVCCLVGSTVIPLLIALSPQFTQLINKASEAQRSQAENEKTALGAILNIVATNNQQISVLNTALEIEQKKGFALSSRISELEKVNLSQQSASEDCLKKLEVAIKRLQGCNK
jgi:hypothetical protein